MRVTLVASSDVSNGSEMSRPAVGRKSYSAAVHRVAAQHLGVVESIRGMSWWQAELARRLR
jgi:hypothetical protein